MAEQRIISFSPPDIGDDEIAEVTEALRSGWITTGPKTKRFENELASFTGAERVAGFASATAALECALRALGVGPGDEVITSAYTYTASCSPICHVGATPVLCDTAPGSYEMDYDALPSLITEKTRAVIPIDIAGRMCDYDRLFAALAMAQNRFSPSNERQEALGRLAVVADGAHALGATRDGQMAGSVADLTAFSFHAVKNLTTAEGGALAWRTGAFADPDELYHEFMLMSLHGQTKDALTKTRAGAWEYDIAFPGWKCNMTDIQAAIGLAQLRRYPGLLARRRQLVERYESGFASAGVDLLQHYGEGRASNAPTDISKERAFFGASGLAAEGDASFGASGLAAAEGHASSASIVALPADAHLQHGDMHYASSGHLMLVRLLGKGRAFRDQLIERMAERGVATNVHYKPLPMLTAYRNLGFDIADFPNAFAQFENEITLPLHTLLSDDDVDYIVETFLDAYAALEGEGV